MRCTINYKPVEVAFHIWVSNYPFSGHPLDDRRFYSFVSTIHRYSVEGRKWRQQEYFIKRIREYGYHQQEDKLIEKYQQMILILDYLESEHYPIFHKERFFESDDFDSKYSARTVIDRKMINISISKNDFDKDKVNLKSFKK